MFRPLDVAMVLVLESNLFARSRGLHCLARGLRYVLRFRSFDRVMGTLSRTVVPSARDLADRSLLVFRGFGVLLVEGRSKVPYPLFCRVDDRPSVSCVSYRVTSLDVLGLLIPLARGLLRTIGSYLSGAYRNYLTGVPIRPALGCKPCADPTCVFRL